MCRSDPQIAVVVTLMIASRGLRMTGSGTVSTWMFSVPSQQTARMVTPYAIAVARGFSPASSSCLKCRRSSRIV